MPEAISDTSPLVYLYRIGALDWLHGLFGEIWVPGAVVRELDQGRSGGYDVPDPRGHNWIRIVEPRCTPSEWLALGLGAGEVAAMALALENPGRILLLDDSLARRIAHAAGLNVLGTLKILFEAKAQGLTGAIAPLINRLEGVGMWLSADVRRRILGLADEGEGR